MRCNSLSSGGPRRLNIHWLKAVHSVSCISFPIGTIYGSRYQCVRDILCVGVRAMEDSENFRLIQLFPGWSVSALLVPMGPEDQGSSDTTIQ